MNKFHESQDNQQLLSREEQQEAVAELTAPTEGARDILARESLILSLRGGG